MKVGKDFRLIVSIVKKGWSEKIVCTAQDAGSKGATVIPGRGCGDFEMKKLLGLQIEPEKDVVLVVTHKDKADGILKAIVEKGNFEKVGTGICFIIELEKVAGLVYLLDEYGVDE